MESRELFRFRGSPILVMGIDHVSIESLWAAAGCPDGDAHWSRYLSAPVTRRRIQKLRDENPGMEPIVIEPTGGVFVHKYLASSYAEYINEDLWHMVRQHLFGELPPGSTAPRAAESVSGQPMSKAQLQLLQAQLIADHDQAIADLRHDVNSIKQDREQARKEMAILPVPSPSKIRTPTRAHVNMVIRNYAQFHGITDYRPLYNRAYRELCYRHHIDLKTRANNRGKTPIEIVEEDGFMEKLYVIVCEMYLCDDRLGGTATG